jgi:hypothetical protein
MRKSVATFLSRCQQQTGHALAALLLLTLMPAAGVEAAEPAPSLQRSELLDTRRLGKLSEEERAVLRIEWRAGLARVEETRGLQDIMDKLRRMEGSLAAVSVLVRNMPATKSIAEPMVQVSDNTDDYDWRLMSANIAALTLVAVWWFGRRKSLRAKAAVGGNDGPASVTAGPAIPPDTAVTSTLKVASPLARELPLKTTAPSAPPPDPIVARPEAADLQATPVAPPQPPQDTADALGKPEQADSSESVGTSPTIDFSLEEAEPEAVAALVARQRKMPAVQAPTAVGSVPEKAVEPTLQLAEIMLSMGLEQGAAQALLEYSEANPRHAIYHLLKLLGIYRKRGLQKEFTEAAEKLRKNFNIQAEDWAVPGTGEAPTLEKFSRVAEHVQTIWTQPEECISYLRHLIEDNRDGARAGFPQSVAEEILLMIEILKDNSGGAQTAT